MKKSLNAANKKNFPDPVKGFPVVGVGASAGGLEAFKKLIAAIGANSGMAYVLVQHLDPSHESMLTELLQRNALIPVIEITDKIEIKPDHIYILPSNKILVADNGILQLTPRQDIKLGRRILPIDLFFTSLAQVYGVNSIGVVLTGTGSDGTEGLKAIKENGGVTLTQDLFSAKFKEMPQNAIQSHVVDFVLAPENMPAKLLEIKQKAPDLQKEIPDQPKSDDEIFRQILLLLRLQRGTDFTYYKQTTIRRRMLRRMAFNNTGTPSVYLSLLQENPGELENLYKDLLIPVTSFFRDDKIFNDLCKTVFPRLIRQSSPELPVRIWVAGCSKGQEAYSIAICLKEYLKEQTQQVQILATDISPANIDLARKGVYDESEMAGVNEGRIKTFFSVHKDKYHIAAHIREMCVFACHDFLKDPPFGKIDLISCRNVLIYMEPLLQKKVLRTFHYALQPGGLLWLGKSETASAVPDLFAFAVKTDKIFTRKDTLRSFLPSLVPQFVESAKSNSIETKNKDMQPDFQKSAIEIMLSRYTPAGVVVNEEREIVYFHGSTGLYLQPPTGKPSYNLLKMARNGLAFELRNILHKAKKQNGAVTKAHIPLIIEGHHHLITIEAMPLSNIAEPHYLILFLDDTHHSPPAPLETGTELMPGLKRNKYDQQVEQLQKELTQAREDMRTITEDQEAANEELQSANEELLSSSEELQSLNEELETSKEELQTTNEELTVVNQELSTLAQELTRARDYAQSIVTTVRTPLLVLDKDLKIVSANPAFYSTFQVTSPETEGISIYELGNRQWDIHALRELLEKLLPSNASFTDFKVTHHFPKIGERVMFINGLEIISTEPLAKLILLSFEDKTEDALLQQRDKAFQEALKVKIAERTRELQIANEELQQKNQEIALSMYNKRFLTEFSERFSTYQPHFDFFKALVLYIADLVQMDYVLVGRLTPSMKTNEFNVETIAITKFRVLAENIVYSLEDGPCQEVINGSVYSYPENFRTLFPENNMLKIFNVEGSIGYPLYDPNGDPIGLIAVMHESKIADPETVTSILKIVAKRAEIELERITIEQKLLTNNKMLEEKNSNLSKLNKELESFTYISSHDLQEPLRKIQSFSNRILGKEADRLTDKGREYFTRIQDSAKRMQTLIEDLLAYSRSNITERVLADIDVSKVIDDVKVELTETIKEKNAVIEVGNLCPVRINFYQFRQIMINLIGNALKFSKPDVPPVIKISSKLSDGKTMQSENANVPIEALQGNRQYCHISVADNGIGFDPRYKDQIFEVFQRLYGSDEYPGTGMGLAIVKRIIGNYEGYITATGEQDRGSRFDLYFPHDN